MWIINDDTKRVAVDAISRQIMRPETMDGIRRFVTDASPPWRK